MLGRMDKDGCLVIRAVPMPLVPATDLVPGAARLQMDFPTSLDRGAVADGGQDDAAGVGHQHDRAGADEQVYRLGQSAGGCGQQIAVLDAQMVQTVVADGQGC